MRDSCVPFCSASFSDCGNYRWWLKVKISSYKKNLFFIGLNPSKANEYRKDSTLRRLITFSRKWGYGNLLVMNLFSRVSSSPRILRHCTDPIGEKSDKELSLRAKDWSLNPEWDLWLGWGTGGSFLERDIFVLSMLVRYHERRQKLFPEALGLLSIGCTLKGFPRHPLYSKSGVKLKDFQCSTNGNICTR